MGILTDIGWYFWRLAPGNPIVVRVVAAGGKRVRHMWARFAYLAILFVVMVVASGELFRAGSSLADLAKNASSTFIAISIVQLILMSLVAPVFTAGAITQERDSNTFDILLTTPLTNAQIVLGTLLSRLMFVWLMLLSGLPIFAITMIYGGVTSYEIFQSLGLAATTGLVAGATAIMIAMAKAGTRSTIFWFFLGVAIYLLGVGALGWYSGTWVPEAPRSAAFSGQQMSWLAPFHPFLALFVITGQTPAPPLSEVIKYGWPWRWMLANPAGAYMVMTTLLSVVMVAIGLLFVRQGQKEGEATLLNRLTQFTRRQVTENNGRSRPARRVWKNPIAWREANTRGNAVTRAVMRFVFILGGLVLGLFLLYAFYQGWFGLRGPGGQLDPALMRQALTAIVWIELAVILLVVTNTAAGTLTREKESQSMEILLTTPLTSHYIVAGMLQGLVRFTVPLVAVPTGTLLIFVVADLIRGGTPVTTWESVLLAPLLMLAFCALAAIVGLHFSLTSRTTVRAVMVSTAIVLGVSGLITACGLAVSQGSAQFAAVVLPFTPFPAMQALIDVPGLSDAANLSRREFAEVRGIRAFTTLIAAAVYLGVTFALYQNMVKSFDRIVRKQAR
jgi:ABC-type transport system involved in multi-copper enzyme maturation permease subunit